jgi:16S rRNA (cytosine1402-N4)-methyltransferase
MMAGSGSEDAAAGGLARHIPVLSRAAIAYLNVRDGGVYVDATFGGGGYSREILKRANCRVIGIDRDPSAIEGGGELARASGGRLLLVHARISQLQRVLSSAGSASADGMVLDLGVSSMQLDDAARGFSFRHDGPLDMRMGDDGPSAADVLSAINERDLAGVIATLGEERYARAVARAIVRARAAAPIGGTRALAEIVAGVVHARPGGIHPATRTFQALRIFVNDELTELVSGLVAAEKILKPGGRLVVVSFHSLEDRIVKSFLAQRGMRSAPSRHLPQPRSAAPTFRIIFKRPIMADETEIAANLRARSAKLRAAERTDAPHQAVDIAGLLPHLPSLAEAIGRKQ